MSIDLTALYQIMLSGGIVTHMISNVDEYIIYIDFPAPRIIDLLKPNTAPFRIRLTPREAE